MVPKSIHDKTLGRVNNLRCTKFKVYMRCVQTFGRQRVRRYNSIEKVREYCDSGGGGAIVYVCNVRTRKWSEEMRTLICETNRKRKILNHDASFTSVHSGLKFRK